MPPDEDYTTCPWHPGQVCCPWSGTKDGCGNCECCKEDGTPGRVVVSEGGHHEFVRDE